MQDRCLWYLGTYSVDYYLLTRKYNMKKIELSNFEESVSTLKKFEQIDGKDVICFWLVSRVTLQMSLQKLFYFACCSES